MNISIQQINYTSLFIILMSNFKELVQSTQKYLLSRTKELAINHKKKLAAFAILIIAGYIIKKKMTMAHLVALASSLTRLIQYLPLPDYPKLRELSPYEHPNPAPLKVIFQAIKVQEIKTRIANKEGTWQQLKQSIITGAILTLTLYNINSFYFLVQSKYLEQFKLLLASSQFDEAMFAIRKRFIEEVPFIFNDIKMTIQTELNKLDIQAVYNIQELESVLGSLVDKVFEKTFDVKEQYKKSVVRKSNAQSVNLFTSPYQYIPAKGKSILKGIALGAVNVLGGCIKILNWFPQVKQQVSSHRYDFVRRSYLLSILKADVENINWPNTTSKNLFSLVFQQMTYSLLSLNFSLLLKEHSAYQKKILTNRIRLWLITNRSNNVKLLKLLPALYKILKEQFFKNDIFQYRDAYHEKQLKKSIKHVSLAGKQEEQQQMEGMSIQQNILEEIEQKRSFHYLERQFQLKYFNQRSGVVHKVKKNETGKKDSKQMEALLNMIGGNQVLNQLQQ